jgi:hypothetical protein
MFVERRLNSGGTVELWRCRWDSSGRTSVASHDFDAVQSLAANLLHLG